MMSYDWQKNALVAPRHGILGDPAFAFQTSHDEFFTTSSCRCSLRRMRGISPLGIEIGAVFGRDPNPRRIPSSMSRGRGSMEGCSRRSVCQYIFLFAKGEPFSRHDIRRDETPPSRYSFSFSFRESTNENTHTQIGRSSFSTPTTTSYRPHPKIGPSIPSGPFERMAESTDAAPRI